MKTKVWAHRGASAYAPENTLEAFRLAAEQKADGVELDVQLSKDGELVVIHDETIDRVSDGSGYVRDYTLEELKRFHFNRLHPEYADARIPTLAEVYELLKPTGLEINVEIKTGIYFYPGIEEKLFRLEQALGMQGKIIYSSFNHYSVMKMREYDPKAKTGLLYADGFQDVPGYAAGLGADALHPALYNLQYEGFLKACREKKLLLHVWTVWCRKASTRLSQINRMWPEELWITADFYVPAVEKLWLIAVGNQQPQRLDDGKIVSVSV